MRRLMVAVVLLSWSAMVAPAFALQADDTMSAWKGATKEERAGFLKRLLGDRGADVPRILQCMDETSKTPGHIDLNIADVANVCASADKAGQPV